MKEFDNFNSAYLSILADLYFAGKVIAPTINPLSISTNFGTTSRLTKEIIGYSFVLTNPADRALFIKARPINLPYAIANAVWTLAGLDSLDFISLYNSRGEQFSDNGISLYGAHGKRLFDNNGVNQIAAVIRRLKKDPHTRRAVATIYRSTDAIASSKDIPCSLSVHFLQREGKLHAVINMRSQSAAMVLPYDLFVFSFLQEVVAVELGYELGNYYHISNSFQYYEDEADKVQNILQTEVDFSLLSTTVPRMPSQISPLLVIKDITVIENKFRKELPRSISEFDELTYELHQYWKDILLVLTIGIAKKLNKDVRHFIKHLPDYYARHF